jgi:predicted Fe-Mo cluster-binding NifX family protein
MKLMVTAQGPELSSPVEPRFGRAPFFVLVDQQTGAAQGVANEVNLNAVQGAGIQSGKRAVDLGADAVLSGHVGPKAFDILSAAGIKVYIGTQGTVADAIEQMKNGQLQLAAEADVQGHW